MGIASGATTRAGDRRRHGGDSSHGSALPVRVNLACATPGLGPRHYELFFAGRGISLIGTWMARIAMRWLVYRLPGSAVLLGVVGFASQIPAFVLGPVAGVWVD